MTSIDDLLEFKQEEYKLPLIEMNEFEEIVRNQPFLREINKLRDIITNLSEQVTLLQKDVDEKKILPARIVQIFAPPCKAELLYNGKIYKGAIQGEGSHKLNIEYVIVNKDSICKRSSSLTLEINKLSDKLPSARIDIPRDHKLRIISAIWTKIINPIGEPDLPSLIQLRSLPITDKLIYQYSMDVDANGGEIL